MTVLGLSPGALAGPVLERTDFFRGPGPVTADPTPYKEWHHFVVHGEGCRILVNFSLCTDASEIGGPPVARVIVLVHQDGWRGHIAHYDLDETELSRAGIHARFGASVLTWREGAYQVDVSLPEQGIVGRIRLEPRSRPFVKNNQPLAPGSRMSWLFVPRLVADGWLMVGGQRFSMRAAAAYHDHNWGRFRWGDDFGWQWGSIMPTSSANPWTIVFARMTDRGHRHARSQGLYVWREDEPVVMFRDANITIETSGPLRQPPGAVIPGVMRLVSAGSASDIPAEHRVTGRRGDDRLELTFRPDDYGRVVIPSETDDEGTVVLNEVSGRVEAHGSVNGEPLRVEGSGVFEYLRA